MKKSNHARTFQRQLDVPPPAATGASIPSACISALAYLAERLLFSLSRGDDPWQTALTLADLRALGLTPAGCQLLLTRELVTLLPLPSGKSGGESGSRATQRSTTKPRLGPRSPLLLTDAGLALVTKQAQSAPVIEASLSARPPGEGVQPTTPTTGIPSPAFAFSPSPSRSPLLPSYDADLRELSVAGVVILRLPVQGHNLATVLKALELGGWRARIDKPLNGRPDSSDPAHLANAVYSLNLRQKLIEFHADGGAVRWQWRSSTENAKPHSRGRTTSTPRGRQRR
ncbi:MAG TPA: hypothetical protein VF278_12785 [Pirellulales bacterium]